MRILFRMLIGPAATRQGRLVASLAIGFALGGLSCLALVFLAWLFPSLAYFDTAAAGPGGIPPPMIWVSEEMGLYGFIIAWAIYLSLLMWIWGPVMMRHRHIMAGILMLLLWLGTFVAARFLSRTVRGYLDGELLSTGLLLLAGCASVLISAWTFDRYLKSRPVYGKDGHLDLRCVECGYLMVGLSEARCPECGQRYTIDELLVAQHFDGIQTSEWAYRSSRSKGSRD